MENFMESAQSRETSQELIEAIYYVSGNDDEEAVRVWEYPTETEMISIWERVTKNGLISSEEFCWGVAGSKWAKDIERYINALNSVSREDLTDDEWGVIDNWEDLNA